MCSSMRCGVLVPKNKIRTQEIASDPVNRNPNHNPNPDIIPPEPTKGGCLTNKIGFQSKAGHPRMRV